MSGHNPMRRTIQGQHRRIPAAQELAKHRIVGRGTQQRDIF